MNFNIVDGDNGYRELLPKFSELYNDKQIRVATIKKQLGLCQNDYRKLRRDAIKEGLITPRTKPYNTKKPTYKTNPRYVCKSISKGIVYFIVTRTINGKRIFYGNFKDIRQADRMVELLKENDWDINKRDELKQQVLEEWNCRK